MLILLSNRGGQAPVPGVRLAGFRVLSAVSPRAAACWRRRSGSAEVVHASPGRGLIVRIQRVGLIRGNPRLLEPADFGEPKAPCLEAREPGRSRQQGGRCLV